VRILTLDIETSPIQAYVWRLHGDQHIAPSQVIEPSRVLCVAGKWHDKSGVMFTSEYHDGHDEMVRIVWGWLDEADVVVGWNSKSFDLKHLSREFALAGLPPPSPWHDCDMLPIARRRFKWASNKLEHVSDELGIGRKVQHHGFALWRECLDGDDNAWTVMRRYCKHDVVLTDQVFTKFREYGWIDRLPHVGLYGDDHQSLCGRCGSNDLMKRGWSYTATARFQRFQCQKCQAYSRASHADRRQYIRPVA
jgi:DNA polymerase elongation subunit (family B)